MSVQQGLPGIQSEHPPRLDTYGLVWKLYTKYAEAHELDPRTPATVAAYLDFRAADGKRPETLRKDLHGIAYGFFKELGIADDPRRNAAVSATITRLLTEPKTASKGPQSALLTSGLHAALHTLRTAAESPLEQRLALRDAAILLVLFAGALRREEARTLDRNHIWFTNDGMVLRVRRSTKRPMRDVTILRGEQPECDPVNALKTWVDTMEITHGPAFVTLTPEGESTQRELHPVNFSQMISKRLRAAGVPTYGAAHALKRGSIALVAAAGANLAEAKEHADVARSESIKDLVASAHANAHRIRRMMVL